MSIRIINRPQVFCHMTMQNSLLLQQQIHQIELVNQYRRKKKEETKHFIQNGGSLTVAEVKEKEEEQRELERDAQFRSCRPPTCSDCGVIGHNINVLEGSII